MRHIGKDIAHESAAGHVSGESMFLDDLPPLAGELLAGIVHSPLAHGKLLGLNLDEARNIPGVVAILTAADIKGHNRFGPVFKDEDLIVEIDGEAVFLGQPLAIVAATSYEALDAARKAAVVEMEELPAIFTIDQAIEAQSYIGNPRHMARGEIAEGFKQAERLLQGVLEIGGQEHFYLESQISIVVPGEGGTMTVHSSTQHPTEVQAMVAEVLGVPFNHVTCICKRMGGGFGGKETQAAQPAMMAALLAAHTKRPVRFAYTKDDDMRFTGKRHPFKIGYRAGVKSDGTLTALELELFSNGGCSADLSFAVLERAMLHSDNAYFLPNVKITGRVCRTNLPSNTAFRGFGGPQGVVGIENILQQVAIELGLDAYDVRVRNCYGVHDRNVTHYGQRVGGRDEGVGRRDESDSSLIPHPSSLSSNPLPDLFDLIHRESNYRARRREIDAFNQSSRTHLRGLAISPVKFGISFTRRTLNQANALVNIYLDGSVMVSTGATEMGQGVHTRIRQIVADELGIGFDKVIVSATNTDKNNNTSPTAASSGTDLNGAAAADACKRLRARMTDCLSWAVFTDASCGLAPAPESIRFGDGYVWDERVPQNRLPFAKAVMIAYEHRVSLGERGFYATPGVDFNRDTGKGNPFLYFTNGIACSEVLIDRFTGEMKVPRVDLIMDVGVPLNPGIDRGQIIGGFIQGMGWVTTEELCYGPKGQLLSYSPTTYKIPNISDVPAEFNVRFLDNPHNAVSIYRSKAVGEPPLLLGISVWLAVKDALSSAEPERCCNLKLPATGEQILSVLTRALPGEAPDDHIRLAKAIESHLNAPLSPSIESHFNR